MWLQIDTKPDSSNDSNMRIFLFLMCKSFEKPKYNHTENASFVCKLIGDRKFLLNKT